MADEAVLIFFLQNNRMSDSAEIPQEGPPLAWPEATQCSLYLGFLTRFLLAFSRLVHNPEQWKKMH